MDVTRSRGHLRLNESATTVAVTAAAAAATVAAVNDGLDMVMVKMIVVVVGSAKCRLIVDVVLVVVA